MSTSEMSEKKDLAPAPAAFDEFTKRFPKLGEAWALMAAAGGEGPLDLKTQRLVKLAVAIGAMREGAVRSAVRKALAAGGRAGGHRAGGVALGLDRRAALLGGYPHVDEVAAREVTGQIPRGAAPKPPGAWRARASR